MPILIVQHMPSGFIASLAQRLNSLCSITVREAKQHQRIESGVAYLAPAGAHMRVMESLTDQKPRIVLDPWRGKEGGVTIGQDESSCTVYGMPRVCAELGVLTRTVTLVHIPNVIMQAIKKNIRPSSL